METEKSQSEAAERLVVREMEEGDLPQISAIEAETFSVPWSLDAFRKSMALEETIFLTAEWNGETAGYCGCYLSLDEAEITNVAVKKEFRRLGIGKAMLAELFRRGRLRGAGSFLLEVRAGNQPAISLYEDLGFEPGGRRRNFYEHPREDALILWKRFPDA